MTTASTTTKTAAMKTAATKTTETNEQAGAAPREDLLALTEDALAALGNRGLVKRAVKELAAGSGARITVSGDGAIEASYPDGVVASLAAGAALDRATCTCAAPGLCRHRIGLVLAYRQQAVGAETQQPSESEPELAAAPASPADIEDDTLRRVFGARSLDAARRQCAKGYDAVVYAAAARVELPVCTVTFHVPGDPAYATTEAVEAYRAEAVVLAVWAFRAFQARPEAATADDAGPGAGGVRVHVGGTQGAVSEVDLTALEQAGAVVDSLLFDGVANAGPLLRGNLRHVATDLDAASMPWPAAVVEDLADQADWYAERSARHAMTHSAELMAEFQARRRAAAAGRAVSPRVVLGTGEPRTTPLRRVRLIGLGARVSGGTNFRTAELFFAHPQDGTVLVLRRTWPVEEEKQAQSGTGQLRSRRVGGAPLYQLAAANLVSEAATRSASRVITLGTQTIGKTAVLPVGNAWRTLPDSLVVRDYAALVTRLARRGPRHLRPRVEAQDVFVLAVSKVAHLGYDPAEQRLEAVVEDEFGMGIVVSAEYSAHTKPALGAMARALGGETAETCMISGAVTVRAGQIVLRPLAFWLGDGAALIVPDLEPEDSDQDAQEDGGGAAPFGRHANPSLLDQAADLLVEHAHRGLGMLAASAAERVGRIAADARRLGLTATGALLADYAATLAAEDRAARIRAWTDCTLAVDACR
ncbi:hypothetical protein KDL01_27720 [Actinospica durhamensis]|uniref:SWIM-type domain-containing protein n=1 Tax=Actinospica durhamensis TaxID=1508375 RepID=A0A941EVE3_9ACTN|nr:hypothetical protein [Actinospica durhamensis]MBR7837097.1 hypothetical protein [Actinospica durhamensis]